MTQIAPPWLTDPATRAVMAAVGAQGYSAFFVGGCVRNALLGAAASDIDIATDAHPDQVVRLGMAAGLQAVPTGIDHGTVTLVCDGQPFEVTTFRRDVATDGRRAVVAFGTSIEEDALRRDFTMNALYATADGQVLDPLGGMDDLRAGRVRFIGQAQDRICEDYLRSLRFFRFDAWYGDQSDGLDAAALDAIASNLGGIDTLSRERVGAEVVKLLSAPDPARSLAAMETTGVLLRVLPGASSRDIGVLVHLEHGAGLAPDPIRRLALIGAAEVETALRLPRKKARRMAALRDAARDGAAPAELGYRLGASDGHSAVVVRAALMGAPPVPGALDDVARGAAAEFPIKAADLAPLEGAALGAKLRALEAAWIASDLTLDRGALLKL